MWTRRQFVTACAGSAIVIGEPRLLLSPSFASETVQPIILTAKTSVAPLAKNLGGEDTRIWGYNNLVPGPVIRARRGDTLHVRLVNELEQPTSIHWHGVRIDNAMDGVPGLTQDAVPPGESFDYIFTVPDAGSFWYHTHNRTWEQLARGLYGLLIVEDDDDQLFDRDIYLAIDDWKLTQQGQIEETSLGDLHAWAHEGRLGNWLTVNGQSNPEIAIKPGERVRIRMANTANARVFEFAFSGLSLQQIALDGHPTIPTSIPDSGFLISPGQRLDLLFDAVGKPGDRIVLNELSYDKPLEAARIVLQEEQALEGHAGSDFPGLQNDWGQTALDMSNAIHQELVIQGGAMGSMDSAVADGEVRTWQDLVGMKRVWAMNGVAGDLESPLMSVERGQTVIVDMINDTRWAHAMHLHGHHFKVVRRNDQTVEDAPWRDTELIGIEETVSIAFVADNPGKWVFHCHMIEHQAGGMVTWINVAG